MQYFSAPVFSFAQPETRQEVAWSWDDGNGVDQEPQEDQLNWDTHPLCGRGRQSPRVTLLGLDFFINKASVTIALQSCREITDVRIHCELSRWHHPDSEVRKGKLN